MFSNPLLKDFVYSIPLCQAETDLGSILNIFQCSNCQELAVSQNDGRWGIINAKDLLSLITVVWLSEKTVVHGHPRSTMHRQSIRHTNNNLNSIVKSAKVYQEDITLDEFLKCLPPGSLSRVGQEYLLVNKSGELQGKLDKSKVLEHLAFFRPNSIVSNLRSTSGYLINLLDSLPLPVKLETTWGECLYSNTYWQQRIELQSSRKKSQPNQDIASWWIEQQLSKISSQGVETFTRQFNRASENSKSDRLTKLSSFNIAGDSEEDRTLISPRSPLQIEQFDDWNYLKIPLISTKQLASNLEQCWLILAIEANEARDLSKIAAIKTVTNKLLATISHELKSPVTGIMGLSSLLETQKLGDLNQRQARYLKLIHDSGQQTIAIINDLAELTSLIAKPETEPELLDLEVLCRQTYRQVLNQLALERDNLSLTDSEILELDLDSLSQIQIVDRSCLSSILFHLIIETIEFADSLERLKIKITSLERFTAITVSKAIDTIASNSSSTNNSSLNLAIAEYLAEVIGASVSNAYSSSGCQFTLLLPKLQSEPVSDKPTAADTTKNIAKRLTILCLSPKPQADDIQTDDCRNPRLTLQRLLDYSEQQASEQYRIIEADGLEQAHTLARIWPLDVIVLEGSRTTNPVEYLRSLRESEYLSALPLIILDNRTTEAANQIDGLNVYPCLLPPQQLDIEDLMQVIKIAAE